MKHPHTSSPINIDHEVYIESLGYDRETNRIVLIFGYNGQDNVQVYIDDSPILPSLTGIDLPYDNTRRYDIDPKKNTSIIFQSPDRDILNIRFTGQMSKLSHRFTYWIFNQYLVTHNGQSIVIRSRNTLETFIRETILLGNIIFVHRRLKVAALRILYWVTKPLLQHRTIWLFSDKVHRAGDNAEYVYRYARKQLGTNIKFYYVLSNSSPDAARFDSQNLPYLRYKSLKQRLLFLHADVLIFTHNNAPGFYRFGGENSIFFRDLYNYDTMYIQHGLSVQDMSHLYHKGVDDIKRYFVASPFETKNLLQSKYGYLGHEVLPSGLARYDGLVNSPTKNILIAPTWRKEIVDMNHDYDKPGVAVKSFTSTQYYATYNELIVDSRLLACARENDYTITLLLHPALSDVADAFSNKNDSVSVISPSDDISYESLLSEASILLTDYSGLQFDFAYMYKPVVYYHPKELPSSYEESVYKYSSDALGRLFINKNDVVDELCSIITKKYQPSPEYTQKIDSFFYYHDHKNAKRIFEIIANW